MSFCTSPMVAARNAVESPITATQSIAIGACVNKVADAVHDECLVACRGRVLFQKVEADQQVTAESHAFPAHEQQQEILREHQNQHEKHEQVEVCEKAIVSVFVRHVADRINMDQQ